MNKVLSLCVLFLIIGLGLLTGWLNIPFFNSTATVISDLFLRLLKLISLPIIFLAITSTVTGIKSWKDMHRLGRKVFAYTLATTLIAASIALLLYVTLRPTYTAIKDLPMVQDLSSQPSYVSFLLNIIPSNLFSAFVEGNVMGIVFVALLLSIAILLLPEEQKLFLNKLFSTLFAAILKTTHLIIKLMPIAIWAFMLLFVKEIRNNYSQFHNIMLYIVCVLGANLIQGLIVLPLLLKVKKVPVLKTVSGMGRALVLAFFSKSSNATLPVTLQCAEKNLGINSKIANFTIPLCSVINMNGCAAFILTTVLFVSSSHGFTFSIMELIGWIFVATCAAIGNAGVPMGCFFLTSAFLIGMNVPLYLMGLILPFYTLLDMVETALNVWSDGCVAILVDKDLKEDFVTSTNQCLTNQEKP